MATGDDTRRAELLAMAQQVMRKHAERRAGGEEVAPVAVPSGAASKGKDIGRPLQVRYEALQDVLATAQYLAIQAHETREFTIAGVPYMVDASTNIPELIELILAEPIKADPDGWAAAKQKKFASLPDFKTIQQARDRLPRTLKSVQMLFPDAHLAVADAAAAPVTSVVDEFTPTPVEPAVDATVVIEPVAGLPVAPQEETLRSISLEEEAMHALNKSVMKTAVETIGPDLARTIQKISYMPESIRLAIQRHDNAAIDQLATLMGLFAEHLGTIPEFTEESGKVGPTAAALKTLQDVLGKMSELRTVEAVQTNPTSPPSSVGKYPAALNTLCNRLQKMFPVLQPETTLTSPQRARHLVDYVIHQASHGEMSNLDVASELHAAFHNERLLGIPDFTNWFKLGENHTKEDEDVRLVLMHLCRTQIQDAAVISKHIGMHSEDMTQARAVVLQKNKDVLLYHYLNNHYGEQAQITPQLPDEARNDKVLLGQWIIGQARRYLDSGEGNQLTDLRAVALWQLYQQAVITEKTPYVQRRDFGEIDQNIERVFGHEFIGPTEEIGLLPEGAVDTDRSIVMGIGEPAGRVGIVEHSQGVRGGGAEHPVAHHHGRHEHRDPATGEVKPPSGAHTTMIRQKGAFGYDDPFAKG